MLKRKGFTLIEVIVSIAIIGLIAVSFLPSLTNHFRWIVDTRTDITDMAFGAQETIESNINVIKAFISDPTFTGDIDSGDFSSMGITKKIVNVDLFEDTYPIATYTNRQYPNAYQTEAALDGNRTFKAWVGDKRLPGLEVPKISVVSLLLTRDGVENNGHFEYFDYPNLMLKANSNMFENPQNSFNRYRSDWYVSKPGFNIPVPDVGFIDEDLDFGRIYPSFPDDYMASPIYTELGSSYSYVSISERNIVATLSNSIVNQYPGRHIIYTITPFAKSLKKGTTSTILPLYIYGPDTTDNLAVHLDASTINKDDKYDSSTNPNGSIHDDDYHLRNWKNTRPSLKTPTTAYDAKQTVVANMPILMKTDISGVFSPEIPFQGDGLSSSVWGRSLGNETNTMSTMKISNIPLEDNMSIFMIIRKVDSPLGPQIDTPILQGTGNAPWSVSWVVDAANPQLDFNTGGANPAVLSSTFNLGEWYLVQASVNSSITNFKAINLKAGVDHTLITSEASGSIDTNTIDINWNGIEIAELLIYNDIMDSTELDNIETYLKNKYNP